MIKICDFQESEFFKGWSLVRSTYIIKVADMEEKELKQFYGILTVLESTLLQKNKLESTQAGSGCLMSEDLDLCLVCVPTRRS